MKKDYTMKHKGHFLILGLFWVITLIAGPLANALHSEEKEAVYKWLNISGTWEVQKDDKGPFVIETRVKARDWNYNELINYNTLGTFYPLEGFTRIKLKAGFYKPQTYPVSVLFFFAAEKPYQKLHAFRLTGDEKGFNKAELISSRVIDPNKMNQKGNFAIKVLDSAPCSLEYNKDYTVEMRMNRKRVNIYVNNKKVLKSAAPEDSDKGIIGFSSRGAMMKIDDVTVWDGRKVVLKDDFSGDTIKGNVIKMRKMTKKEYEEWKKEQEKNKKK